MKVIVISSAPIVIIGDSYHAYSPYVKELELWAKYSDDIAFMCPILDTNEGLLISEFNFRVSKIFTAKAFNVKSALNLIRAFLYSFYNFHQIFRGMFWADHIHLRCPGNIGLMGCVLQIFFPFKPKTAKYAGNWDPMAKQPLSYKLQRWILNNTFLTRNMQVLVYGKWSGFSKNIKPFFTATYTEADKIDCVPRKLNDRIIFLFVGTLSTGKRPLYAVQLVQQLFILKEEVELHVFGEGQERNALKNYIIKHRLDKIVILHGNQQERIVRKAYQNSHYLILPSESEGWPKVVAEAMFWGCVPLATAVSCVPFMLDYGNRGMILNLSLENDIKNLLLNIKNQHEYENKIAQGTKWSRKFTIELFESEIKKLLKA